MAIDDDDDVLEALNGHPLGLAGQVYDSMVSLILSGQLKPLQPLRIHSLAKRLGVSATPVREALVRASASGLVSRENNKGFRVSPRPDASQLDDLFEARLTLEPKTAWLAAVHVDDEFLEKLQATWDRQEALSADDTFEGFRAFLNADHDFHENIAQAAGNHYLAAALEAMGSHVQRYRSFDQNVVTDREQTLIEHRTIIEALANRNADAAQAAMTLHLANLRMRVRHERQAQASGPRSTVPDEG